MATVTTFNIALLASTTRFVSAINQAERRWNQFARSVERHAKTMPKAIREATAPSLALGRQVAKGAAVAGAALSALSGIGVRLAAQYEQTTIAFETLLGSAEAADRFLRELDVFARRTPFDPDQLRQSARQLLAFGFAGDQVLKMLTPIGDAVAAMGGNMEVMERIIRAIGQIAAKQRVQSEELLQLTEAGIPAWRYLAEALDTTVADAMERVTKRQVDAATAINAILRGMAKDFGGAMERQSRTILGQWEQVKEGLTVITRGIGQDIIRIFGLANAMQALNNALGRFADTVARTGSFLYALRAAFPPWLPPVIVAIAGAIVGALVPAITAALIPALKRLWTSLGVTTAALRIWALVGAAVAVVAWYVVTNWDTAGRAILRVLARWATAILWVWGMVAKGIAWLLSRIPRIGQYLAKPFEWASNALLGLRRRIIEWFESLGGVRASVGQLRGLERVPINLGKGTERLANAARRAADAQDKLAKGLKSAGKAAADNLQSFDEVHRIETEMGDAGGGVGDVSIPAVKAYEDWANLLDEIAGGIGNIGTAMQDLAGGMGGPTGQMLSLWDEIKSRAKELWENVVEWWARAKERLIEIARATWQGVVDLWGRLKDGLVTRSQQIWANVIGWWDRLKTDTVARVQGIWQGVTTWWDNTKTTVVTRAQEIWASLSLWWSTIKTTITTRVQEIATDLALKWEAIKLALATKANEIYTNLSMTWANIKTTVGTRVTEIASDLTNRWNSIKQTISTRALEIKNDLLAKWHETRTGLAARAQEIAENLATRWAEIKQGIIDRAVEVRDGVSGRIADLRDRLGGIWSSVKITAAETWGRIKGTIRDTVNSIIGYINRFIRALNSIEISLPAIDIPLIGRVGGWTIGFRHIPEIPYLAKGGDITGSGLAVVGEAGPELVSLPRGARVTPLSGGGDIEDAVYRGVWEAMMQVLRTAQATARGEGDREIVLRVDGRDLARVALPAIIAEGQRQGLQLVVRPQGV